MASQEHENVPSYKLDELTEDELAIVSRMVFIGEYDGMTCEELRHEVNRIISTLRIRSNVIEATDGRCYLA